MALFRKSNVQIVALVTGLLLTAVASATDDRYSEALKEFKQATELQKFFHSAYGYALFPMIGKGGIVIGGAYGSGRVYKAGEYVGDSKMTQVSVGFQLGGQAYREIIFFRDKKAFDKFTSGNFEFGAQASAVAINLGASAQAGTSGNSASAGQSGRKQTGNSVYVNGMAPFTATQGGLMYEATLSGQSFSFTGKS